MVNQEKCWLASFLRQRLYAVSATMPAGLDETLRERQPQASLTVNYPTRYQPFAKGR
jgi:hypothetical protein